MTSNDSSCAFDPSFPNISNTNQSSCQVKFIHAVYIMSVVQGFLFICISCVALSKVKKRLLLNVIHLKFVENRKTQNQNPVQNAFQMYVEILLNDNFEKKQDTTRLHTHTSTLIHPQIRQLNIVSRFFIQIHSV